MEQGNGQEIRALFLDLGSVVIDVEWQKTLQALQLPLDLASTAKMINSWEPYLAYERGEITVANFVHEINTKFHIHVSVENFIQGWNACLNHTIPGVIELISQLPPDLTIMAITNTNREHYEHYCTWPIFRRFKSIIASHLVGHRKPEEAIYRLALKEAQCLAHQALFIDDLHSNLNAAKNLGLNIWHVENSAEEMKRALTHHYLLR